MNHKSSFASTSWLSIRPSGSALLQYVSDLRRTSALETKPFPFGCPDSNFSERSKGFEVYRPQALGVPRSLDVPALDWRLTIFKRFIRPFVLIIRTISEETIARSHRSPELEKHSRFLNSGVL